MIRVNCRSTFGELAGMIDESLGAYRLSRFYKLCKSHSKASLSTLLYCLFTAVISLWSWCKTLSVSINEMPLPDALFVFIEISYKMFSIQYNRFRVIRVKRVCNRLYHEVWCQFCHKCGRKFESNEVFCWQCGTIKRHQQESLCSSADERLVIEHYFELRGFRYDTIAHSLGEYHEIYMNVRTLKTGLDPGSWIVDVPFKTGLVVWLVKLISSAFFRFGGQVLR